MFDNVTIDGWSLDDERNAGIMGIILYDYCEDVTDPSDPTELAALVAADDAIVICVINGEKPVGSDITKEINRACGTQTLITGRDVTVTFDSIWTEDNLANWEKINGESKLKFALITCNSEGKGNIVYYDTKTTLSVDDEITGNVEDGSILVKGTLTTRRKKGNLLPKVYDISTAMQTAVGCLDSECD